MIVISAESRNWFEVVKKGPGVLENIKIKNNLHGPWIILEQNDPVCSTWAEQVSITEPTHTFSLAWGKVVYQRAEDGTLDLCAFWYDTSD